MWRRVRDNRQDYGGPIRFSRASNDGRRVARCQLREGRTLPSRKSSRFRGCFLGLPVSVDNDAGHRPEDDYRRNSPRFQGENFQKNLALVGRIEEIAKEKGCTPAQLALAWVLAQGEYIIPIPGTKRRKYLEENVAALAIELTEEDLRRIDA